MLRHQNEKKFYLPLAPLRNTRTSPESEFYDQTYQVSEMFLHVPFNFKKEEKFDLL